MRIRALLLTLALGTGVAHAQVVSPLGGSTGNPQRPTRPTATAANTQQPTTPAAPLTPTAPATGGPATTAPSTVAPSTAPAASAAPARSPRKTITERFAAANTTHDGKLTLEQARAGRLRAVVRDWDQIDTTKAGYVTLDQIKAHQAAQRAARRAARTAKPTTAAPAAATH